MRTSAHPTKSKVINVHSFPEVYTNADELVARGRLGKERAELFKAKARKCDTIAKIYSEIENYNIPYLDEQFLSQFFDIRRWSVDSEANQPVFFQQMPLDEFELYERPKIGVDFSDYEVDNTDFDVEEPYCRCLEVTTQLGCFEGSADAQDNFLYRRGGWSCDE